MEGLIWCVASEVENELHHLGARENRSPIIDRSSRQLSQGSDHLRRLGRNYFGIVKAQSQLL